MNLDKKEELELVKSRLLKAYSMTIKEQKKWSKKIDELEILASKLEESIGEPFSDEEGVKLLVAANRKLSMELSKQRWGGNIEKYFKDNPKINELLDKTCRDVDQGFRVKSITVLKLKIEKYKEVFKFVEKTYADTKTLGLRELTPDESKRAHNDLQQISWI